MPVARVRPHRSKDRLPRERQLAWMIAETATHQAPIPAHVADMIGNRIIDNAAVAAAALARPPVVAARAQAALHPMRPGATIYGLSHHRRVAPEWAAWANGVAVRDLDFHDTFLAADYAHPADAIAPILAVAQHCGCTGADLVRGIAAAYEIHVALVRGICLHEHRIDHIAHLAPAVAAGLGALLELPVETTFQAVQGALHVSTTTRQSRKGKISSWKAFAPAFAGKMAIEAVDRAMRGEGAPSPAYEGEDGFIAWLLGGQLAEYQIELPARGAPRRAILDTYTKQHAAEYQAQALIDLALRLRGRIPDLDAVREIVVQTSHHTHTVIGTGSNDPQKMDPNASCETLDHSLPYIFAVALQDGVWHHVHSYAPERAQRADTVALWHKIRTVETPEWTQRYHAENPAQRAFGGHVLVRLIDGSVIEDEIAFPDAHPRGVKPFRRRDYFGKFRNLTAGIVPEFEQERFLHLVERLPRLSANDLLGLTVTVPPGALPIPGRSGIFEGRRPEAHRGSEPAAPALRLVETA